MAAKFEKQTGKPISEFTIQWMCKRKHVDRTRQLQFIADRMRYGQIHHYLNRQMKLNLSSERSLNWGTTLPRRSSLGYDLNDPIVGIVYANFSSGMTNWRRPRAGNAVDLFVPGELNCETYPHIEQNLQANPEEFQVYRQNVSRSSSR